MKQQDNIEILEQLLHSVKNRGYKNTLKLLKDNHKETTITNEYDLFVIYTICEQFNITQEELLYSRYVHGDRKYAIGFCVHYMYQKRTLGEIAKNIFKNKNKALLNRYRQMIIDLNKKDLPYFEIKQELDKKIENFK
jgi:hypothetical protein